MKPLLDRGVVGWINDLGVAIEYTNDLPAHRLGASLDDEKLIKIRLNLGELLEDEALHHEYAHAFYGDRACHPATERRAWTMVAQLMIDPMAYARAERISADALFIARELGMTKRVVIAFQTLLVRLGDATYVDARMGAGQWAHRELVA